MLNIGKDTPHDPAEALLPWYVTGQLGDDDRARVEDHLQSCVECQQQLFVERRLIDEFRSMAPNVENGWARLRSQLERPAPSQPPKLVQAIADVWNALVRPPLMGFVAAQAVFLMLGAGLLLSLNRPVAPAYHALGSAPAPAAANVIVLFRPSATEAEIRAALRVSDASLVGGPTDADAYLLHVPAAARAKAVATLQASKQVEMAQPIDGGTG